MSRNSCDQPCGEWNKIKQSVKGYLISFAVLSMVLVTCLAMMQAGKIGHEFFWIQYSWWWALVLHLGMFFEPAYANHAKHCSSRLCPGHQLSCDHCRERYWSPYIAKVHWLVGHWSDPQRAGLLLSACMGFSSTATIISWQDHETAFSALTYWFIALVFGGFVSAMFLLVFLPLAEYIATRLLVLYILYTIRLNAFRLYWSEPTSKRHAGLFKRLWVSFILLLPPSRARSKQDDEKPFVGEDHLTSEEERYRYEQRYHCWLVL